MNGPAVSVILPAYNCEKFIGTAIQSVLQQTFTDFELIIINDGSTDRTEFHILEFIDPRIVYSKNQQNSGLIYSLNKAIDLSQGKYIARMDADDICRQDRLEKQKAFLEQNDDISVVACTIEFINEAGERTGSWKIDAKTIRPDQIKKVMLKENCIAHPTIMMRSGILKALKYKPYQRNIEDYDLWLRVLNHGYKIAKINEPLLQYRKHENSITSTHLKKVNPFLKHLLMKIKFLSKADHISWFSISVFASTLPDLIKGILKSIKNIFKK